MNFTEAQLLGIQIDDKAREVLLSMRDTNGFSWKLKLIGLEKLLVSELRQQNVIEAMSKWTGLNEADDLLRSAMFELLTGVQENESTAQQAKVVNGAIDSVLRGELEMIEISAVYGAQILALYKSMSLNLAP